MQHPLDAEQKNNENTNTFESKAKERIKMVLQNTNLFIPSKL